MSTHPYKYTYLHPTDFVWWRAAYTGCSKMRQVTRSLVGFGLKLLVGSKRRQPVVLVVLKRGQRYFHDTIDSRIDTKGNILQPSM
jgi:hypothetical protein